MAGPRPSRTACSPVSASRQRRYVERGCASVWFGRMTSFSRFWRSHCSGSAARSWASAVGRHWLSFGAVAAAAISSPCAWARGTGGRMGRPMAVTIAGAAPRDGSSIRRGFAVANALPIPPSAWSWPIGARCRRIAHRPAAAPQRDPRLADCLYTAAAMPSAEPSGSSMRRRFLAVLRRRWAAYGAAAARLSGALERLVLWGRLSFRTGAPCAGDLSH